MQLTADQVKLVERIEPFIPYIVKRDIPYVPPHLREDCYSVARLALCECAAKLQPKDNMWLPDYMFSRIRNKIIKFLLKEQKYATMIIPQSNTQTEENDYLDQLEVESGEELVIQQDMCDFLFNTILNTPEERVILRMFMAGYSRREISDFMQISFSSVSRFIENVKKSFIELSELSDVS